MEQQWPQDRPFARIPSRFNIGVCHVNSLNNGVTVAAGNAYLMHASAMLIDNNDRNSTENRPRRLVTYLRNTPFRALIFFRRSSVPLRVSYLYLSRRPGTSNLALNPVRGCNFKLLEVVLVSMSCMPFDYVCNSVCYP